MIALILGTAVGPSRVSAEPRERDTSAPLIVITFDPTTPHMEPAIQAVKSHLAGMRVRVAIEPLRQSGFSLSERLEVPGALAAARRALGAFSIDMNASGDVLVFFTEPEGRAALVRRIRSSSRDLRVSREEGAIVVRSLVQALLDGQRIGMVGPARASGTAATTARDSERSGADGRDTPDAQPSNPTADLAASSSNPAAEIASSSSRAADLGTSAGGPAESHSRRPVLALAAGYIGTRFAPEVGLESGLAIGVRWYALPFAYLGADYTVFPQTVSVRDNATLALRRHPFELVVGYEASSRLAATAELALRVDLVNRSTLETGGDLERTLDDNKVSLGAGLRGGVSWGPVDWFRGTVRVGADVAASRIGFVSKREETTQLIEQSLISPRIELGVAAYFP